MKRFVVVENPPRSVPAFRPVVFTSGRAMRNVMPLAVTTALNGRRRRGGGKRRLTAAQASRLSHRACLASGVRGAKCRTRAAKKAHAKSLRARRLANLARGRATLAARRAGGRVQVGEYGDEVGSFQTNGRRRRKITRKHRRAGGPRSAGRRGRTASNGGRNMASAKQRRARASFVRKFAGKKSHRRRKASRNRRGRPLSGRTYRPTLPKGPLKVIVSTVKRKYSKAKRRAGKAKRKGAKRKASRKGSRRSRASKNPVYTAFNRGGRRKRRLSSNRARAMSMKRWHRNKGKRRARRNFGGGILASLKSALSMTTAKAGLAVLAGAVVATGAPSLFGTWNQGWTGIGLSILTAAGAAVAAKYVAPGFMTEIASGGIVVVGLRLVAQFLPKALSWQSAVSGVQAGFLLPAGNRSGRAGVGGYLPPPPGAISLVGRGRVSGFARAAGEGFKSPRI